MLSQFTVSDHLVHRVSIWLTQIHGHHSFCFDLAIDWYGATDGVDTTSFFATPDGGSLYRIDVTVQTATAIGTYGGTQISGLAFNESNGILYGTDNSSLYSIDTVTGLPTLIGSFGGPDTAWAIDYDQSIDELVAVNNTDQSMYYLDMLTGSATIVGLTGQSRITDIWYDPSSGGMFGVGQLSKPTLRTKLADWCCHCYGYYRPGTYWIGEIRYPNLARSYCLAWVFWFYEK